MALNKLAYLVLPYRLSPYLLCKIINNMTSWRHCLISKVVHSINKNFLLLNSKALVLEGVGLLSGLCKPSYTSGNSGIQAFVFLSSLSIISELSSLNYIYYGRNTS